MGHLGTLTLYGARRGVAGFDELIGSDAGSPTYLRDFSSQDADGNDWVARLYLWDGEARAPSWLEFVRAGFGNDIAVPDRTSTAVVIGIRVRYFVDRYFALTLGGGRFKLDKAAIERGYGLKVALNAIYEDDDVAVQLEVAPRIRQVETRTVGAQTMRALQQVNRETDFDAFGTDAELDQLAGITGSPLASSLGTRMTGKDSIRLGRKTVFGELGEVCRDLARRSTKRTYKKRFDRIDRVSQIVDSNTISSLNDLAVTEFAAGGDFEIAPPELVDFDTIDQFQLLLPDGGTHDFVDPTAMDVRDRIITATGELTTEVLSHCRLIGVDAAGDIYRSWPLWECLDAQLVRDGDIYLLRDGDLYRVDPGYLNNLNGQLTLINESALVLPNSHRVASGDGVLKEIEEGTYNQKAADSSPHLLNLDKKTVRAEGHTSPIEICDLLSTERQLLHVKRKFSSSSLSHLFSQGLVSGRLLVGSPDFRQAVREQIGAGNPFDGLFPDPLVAANYEIVYGIVADWGTRTLIDLPFFSKVNLARHARDLRTMGYGVTYKRIGID